MSSENKFSPERQLARHRERERERDKRGMVAKTRTSHRDHKKKGGRGEIHEMWKMTLMFAPRSYYYLNFQLTFMILPRINMCPAKLRLPRSYSFFLFMNILISRNVRNNINYVLFFIHGGKNIFFSQSSWQYGRVNFYRAGLGVLMYKSVTMIEKITFIWQKSLFFTK